MSRKDEEASLETVNSDIENERNKLTSSEEDDFSSILDGIGIPFNVIQKIINDKCDTKISKDDPINMVVQMLNAFFGDLEQYLKKHNKALTQIMISQTNNYVKEVKYTTQQLSEVLKEASIDAIRNIFEHHSESLTSHKVNMKWCSIIISLSAIINLIIFILYGVKV
jgi:hypothetical protein